MGLNSQQPSKKHSSVKSISQAFHLQRPNHCTAVPPTDIRSPFGALASLFGEFTLIIDGRGRIRSISVSGHTATGRSADVLIGKDLCSLLGDEHWRVLEETICRVLGSGQKEYCEHRVELLGASRWFQSQVVPLNHLSGGSTRIGLFAKDITRRKQYDEKLRKSEALLLQAEALARIGSFELDLRTDELTWSKQLFHNVGLDPRRGITRDLFLKMVHPEDRQRLLTEMEEGIAHHRTLDSEFRCVLANGDVRILHRRAIPLYDDTGAPLALVGMSQDVTERKRAEDEISNREALLAQAEQLAGLGSWERILKTNDLKWSDNLYRILGYKPRETTPTVQLFWQMLPPEDRQRAQRVRDRVIDTRQPVEEETRCILPDGRTRALHSRIVPVFSESGELLRMIGTTQDITERRSEEERLRSSQALLAQAEQLANMGSWEWNLETSRVTWSEHRYRLLGLDPRTYSPTIDAFWNLLHPEDRQRVQNEFHNAIAETRPLEYEARFILADGQVRTVHTRGIPTVDSQGRTIRLAGMAQDITERRNEEDRLRRSEALLAQAEQLATMGSWELDLQNGSVTWSDEIFRMLGLDPRHTVPSMELRERMIHSDDFERVRRDNEQAIAEHRIIDREVRYLRSDGSVRTVYSRAIPIYTEKGEPWRLVGMSQDITDRRNEEVRLRRSEALLAQAEEIANVGSWEQDMKTGRTTLSRQLMRMYGTESEDQWDEDRYWKRIRLTDAESVRAQYAQASKQCQPFEFTARYRKPDGTVRVYHTVSRPIAGENGSTERVLGVVHDITDQTKIEEDLRRLSLQLIRTRDSERRQLARELHESAGQTLAALKMTLGNLEETLPEGSGLAREHLKEARGFAEDAIREVRVVSYLMYPPLLDDAGLGPALSWYMRGFSERSGIQATVQIPSGFGRYSQELESTVFSVVQEALTNVHRYSGSPTVNVRLSHESGAVRAEIEDQGCGLPVLTAASGRTAGFGVGIAGMRERVKQLNGSFKIFSTPGRGTTVRAALPIPHESPAKGAALEDEKSD
jgi:PAS domain S-box-containing protein